MSLIRLFIICLMLAAPAMAMANSDAALRPVFSSVMSDLPIMPGLTEDTNSAIIFDKPDGRIIETRATGALPANIIDTFYNRALPALGWVPVADHTFFRSGEELTYTVITENGLSVLRLNVQPQ